MAILSVLAIQTEIPVFESAKEALYSLSGRSGDVSVIGSGRGHIPGHTVGLRLGLVALLLVF
jgi:hypothetical protein